MFDSKKKQLFQVNKKTTSDSSFVATAMKKTSETLSGNGALKYNTTGNDFVDQFSVLGSYKQPRKFSDIEKDCNLLWSQNKLKAVMFIFYIRMITRVVTLFSGISTKASQKGAELRHEGIMRMIWLHLIAPDTFWKNIGLFVSVGSWKDIITMLSYDLQYNGWENRKLNWDKFGNLILTGLENKNTSELIKKYLPQIKANSKCTTLEAQADNMIAKWICSLLFGSKESSSNYKRYRKLKSGGTAHQWQQLISQKKFDRIDFNAIHGRALNLMVRSKFLVNSGLKAKYEQWITKPETKDVKYTGFVHELFQKLPQYNTGLSVAERETINKQFNTLVEKAKAEEELTNFIVVRDTSGSMDSTALGTNMSSDHIAKSLAIFFSEFLKGAFQNAWIEFNRDAKMHTWKGNTPVEKWYNDVADVAGNTNFMSVIKLFCDIKAKGVREEEFPKGILCLSDWEFDPSELGKTNVESALNALRKAGFSEEYVSNFTIVLWNIENTFYSRMTRKKFETHGDVSNVFYFSGYSASTISFLTSKIRNASELFDSAMEQEILQMIEI